ncbi:MAG: cyclase family protein [Archaeoglobus sp.]|nr:cyclase family protein [Archaeoglobus sp.]
MVKKIRNQNHSLIDLSHEIDENIPTFPGIEPPKIYPALTHAESRGRYRNLAEFELTKVEMVTSVATYLDSPYHRFKDMRDISELTLEETILEGIVVDVRGVSEIKPEHVRGKNLKESLEEKAVLIYTGWDRFWGKKEYFNHPFVTRELAEHLVEMGVKLVGIDTINIDNPKDFSRPAHTILLKNEILIVENLTNIGKLVGKKFRFFAVPLKIRAAAFPVRAFAEVL